MRYIPLNSSQYPRGDQAEIRAKDALIQLQNSEIEQHKQNAEARRKNDKNVEFILQTKNKTINQLQEEVKWEFFLIATQITDSNRNLTPKEIRKKFDDKTSATSKREDLNQLFAWCNEKGMNFKIAAKELYKKAGEEGE